MNIQRYMMLALAVPMGVQAEYWFKKDGITIRSAAYSQAEQVIKTDYVTVTSDDFTSKGMKPVWIEITNDSDHTVAIGSNSVNVPSLQKAALQKKFRYRAMLYPVLASSFSMVILNLLTDRYVTKPMKIEMGAVDNTVVDPRIAHRREVLAAQTRRNNLQPGDMLSAADTTLLMMAATRQSFLAMQYSEDQRLARYTVSKKYLPYSIGGLGLYVAILAAGIGSWWSLSSFNKEFDEAINATLLTDTVNIMPGETVKKLIVFDADKKVESFVFNIRDLVSHGTQIPFDIVL